MSAGSDYVSSLPGGERIFNTGKLVGGRPKVPLTQSFVKRVLQHRSNSRRQRLDLWSVVNRNTVTCSVFL